MKEHSVLKVVWKIVLDDLVDLKLSTYLDGPLLLEVVEEKLGDQVFGEFVDFRNLLDSLFNCFGHAHALLKLLHLDC